MAEAAAQKAVMQVAAVGVEGRVALAEAAHDHGRHVGQRQRQDQQRQQQADAGEPLGRANDADGRQGESEEIGTPIPHENAGRIEVVAQKAQATAGQGRRQQASRRLVQAEAHRQQTHRGDAADPRRQAIETIKPVDGIGDAHQPDQGGNQAEPIGQLEQQIRSPQPGHGQLYGANPHTLVPGHHCNRQLASQAG